jgi:predicted transcriptional regulator
VLERLVRKGKLTRRKAGRLCVYSPEASRDALRRAAIRELVDSFFDGSEEELLRFLRGDRERARDPERPVDGASNSVAAGTIDTILL